MDGSSFNLDFHSVPYYGADRVVEKHYVSARSRRQPAFWCFWRKTTRASPSAIPMPICAKGKKRRKFLNSSRSGTGRTDNNPGHLVFDSKPTTYANLARLDEMKIDFITLRVVRVIGRGLRTAAVGLADR